MAGRVVEGGDVAIAMIEAEAPEKSWNLIKDEGGTAPTEAVDGELTRLGQAVD